MKGHAIQYSAEELAWVEAHRELPRAEAWANFCALFCRSDVTREAYASLCKRQGWLTGRTGRYELGRVSETKGRKMPFHPNSARTRFRKGQLPHNTKFLGHERISCDGYVEISVAETNPHTGYERRYVQKHRWLWEQVHGPVPDGMALKSIDGNRQNTDPSNWVAIPRAMLPRLNGVCGRNYDAAPPELKPAIMTVTELEHKAREARKCR